MLRKIDHSAQKRLLLGLGLSSIISLFAHQRRSLSRSGIVGAIITGTTTCGLGGWSWGLSLVYFFASSSLFSHFRARDKAQTAADKFSKGGQRDIAQVATNGGMATFLALAYGLTSSPRTQALSQAGYVGALATATADTWATELGVLSPQPPRLITTGHVVPPGTSGGITPLGIGASATGALSLGLFFWLVNVLVGAGVADEVGMGPLGRPSWKGQIQNVLVGAGAADEMGMGPLGRPTLTNRYRLHLMPPRWATQGSQPLTPTTPAPTDTNDFPLIALISGLTGSLADSMLGATVQAMYYCPQCEKETERRVHNCGTRTQPLRGVAWMNNDVVNFLATFIGGAVAMLLHYFYSTRGQHSPSIIANTSTNSKDFCNHFMVVARSS